MKSFGPTLVVNGLLPFLAYQTLTHLGLTNALALSLAAVFPAVATLVTWARTRHTDTAGIICLISIAAGVGATVISGDAFFVLIKDSLMTGLFALVCLGSLAALPRPLMFYVGRAFATRGNPERVAWWNGLWERADFRRRQRLLTAVWGVAFAAEAATRVVLALVLPPAAVLATSPLLGLGVTTVLILWTIGYGKPAAWR